MPELSRFLGIVIRMHYRDHGPPHFHAEYRDFEINVDLETGLVTGQFPRRALGACWIGTLNISQNFATTGVGWSVASR